jgi:hypothetical protein
LVFRIDTAQSESAVVVLGFCSCLSWLVKMRRRE